MRTKKEKLIYYFVYQFKFFLILFILIIFLLGYFLFLLPQIKKIFSPELDLKRLEKDLSLRQEFLERLNNLQRDWQNLSPEGVKKIDLALPSEEKRLEYLAFLDLLIRENNFSYLSFTFLAEKKDKKEDLRTLDLSLGLNGGNYLSLKKFLKSLERNLRISDVDSISFSLATNNFNFRIKTYFLEPFLEKEKITWQTKLPKFDSIIDLINSPRFLNLKETKILLEIPPQEEIGRSNPFIPF